jgi:hypothetical protein
MCKFRNVFRFHNSPYVFAITPYQSLYRGEPCRDYLLLILLIAMYSCCFVDDNIFSGSDDTY